MAKKKEQSKAKELIKKLNNNNLKPTTFDLVMSFDDFKECSIKNKKQWNDFVEGFYDVYDDDLTYENYKEFKSLGKVKLEDEGGVFHDGGPVYKVYYFEDYDCYLGYRGYYNSWEAQEYFDWQEVHSKEITTVETRWFNENGEDLEGAWN